MEHPTETGNNLNDCEYFCGRLKGMLMESLRDGLEAYELENPCMGLLEAMAETKGRIDGYLQENPPTDERLLQYLEELLRQWQTLTDAKNRRAYMLGFRDSMRVQDILWPREMPLAFY